VRLTIPELELASGSPVWVDVCKAWQDAEITGTGPSGTADMTKTA